MLIERPRASAQVRAARTAKPWHCLTDFVNGGLALAFILCSVLAAAQPPAAAPANPAQFGPYNGTFLADGTGLQNAIHDPHDSILSADSPWSLSCWIRTIEPVEALELVAGIGSPAAGYRRYLAVDAGKVMLWMGSGNQFAAPATLNPGEWHLLAASFDGVAFHLFIDGEPSATSVLSLGSANPVLQMAPAGLGVPGHHFGGQIAAFTLLRRSLSAGEIHQLYLDRPNFSVINFEEASKPWPFQTRGQAGYRAPQDPATMPHTRTPFTKPVAIKRPPLGPSLAQSGALRFSPASPAPSRSSIPPARATAQPSPSAAGTPSLRSSP
jgi:hypothetical protein